MYPYSIFIITPNGIFILNLWKTKVTSENEIKLMGGGGGDVKCSGQPRPGRNVKSLAKGQPGKAYVNMRKKNADEDKLKD